MTRWKKFFEAQMEDEQLRTLVEEELQALNIGEKIAKLRKEKGLTQTRLAARAGIAASKVSAIENSPQNVELATLIRLARAANKKLKISFS
jgi:DNA-binding XRE family transcriptional regulator